MAKVSFSRHTLPRSYGWLRTSEGKCRRVKILWDSGASHTFVHPRVLNDWQLRWTEIEDHLNYSRRMSTR